MKKFKILLFLTFVVFIAFACGKKSGQPQDHAIIKVRSKMDAPQWAQMERDLLKENEKLMEIFAAKYTNPATGYLEVVTHWGGGDGPDDAMENFYNWPLIYVLGGSKRSLDLFNFVWEGHIKQYSELGMYEREFITAFDWEHNGEGYQPFLMLPLADPDDPKTMERTIRFANFYTGRDTSVSNYDPEHKIIKSILNGSRGARLEANAEYWSGRKGESYFTTSGDWSNVKGDVPMNFIATSLVVNAYILTGDPHYKNWVLEYMGAWRERTMENNGWVPSIVGLNGVVGEGWKGKWYGGLMGWDWTFGGWYILGRGVRIGFVNAAFLGGQEYIDVLRTQGQRLIEAKIPAGNGFQYANKYGPKGPYENKSVFNPLFDLLFSDIYYFSLEKPDLETLISTSTPPLSERHNVPAWKFEIDNGRYEGGNEVAWFNFLEGADPEYPTNAFRDALRRIEYHKEAIYNDKRNVSERQADTPHIIRASKDGPLGAVGAVTGALINLSMGGISPNYCGGLMHCELRYFDPERLRPGLPPDVAALVTAITPEFVKITLVNLNGKESRNVIVQTGGYGEHTCEKVIVGRKEVPVNSQLFEVSLRPGSGTEMTIYRKRFSAQPTFSFPWQN